MQPISLEDLKKREVEILFWIDKICKENKIIYYLAYGTLLGAIRHKGFIPRDDDIDIFMTREHYNKFISITRNMTSKRFSVLSLETDEKYYYPFAKVVDNETYVDEKEFKKIDTLGVWVDIFPLDFFNTNIKTQRKIKLLCSKHLISRYSVFVKSPSPLRNILKFFLYYGWYKYRNPRKYAIKLQNLSTQGDDITKYSMTFAERGRFENDVYDIKLFDQPILTEFEKHQFYIPREYEKILKQNYGDYMKLPPIEKQISNHNISVFIK